MHGSNWIRIGIVTALLLWVTIGCKCERKAEKPAEAEAAGPDYESTVFKLPKAEKADVAALIPADTALVAVSSDLQRLLTFLEGRPWFQDMKRSPVFQDMRFTGGWFEVSTIKHRVESLSAVRFKQANLKEILSTPVALALRPSKNTTEWLLVKQIDLKVQALDRLVEVLNQISPREGLLTTRQVEGLQMRDLRLGEKNHLYYLLFSNILLASNSESYLMQATELAKGESSGSVLDDSDVRASLQERLKGADLVMMIDLLRWSPGKRDRWLADLAPLKRLMFRLDTSAAQMLSVTGTIEQKKGDRELNTAYTAGDILPLDSRLVLGLAHLDLEQIWKRAADRVKDPEILPKEITQGVSDQLIGGLDNQLVLVLGGIDLQGKRPVPHAALLLKIKEGKAAQVATMALKLFTYVFNEKPKLKALAHMSDKKIRVLSGNRAFAPAFAVVDGWLTVCTTEKMLTRLVATSKGQEPAIKDVPGFAAKVRAPSQQYYAISYMNFELLFEDTKAYAKSLVSLGDRFDASAIEETVVPLFDALKKVGKLGGAVTQKGADISGNVVAL